MASSHTVLLPSILLYLLPPSSSSSSTSLSTSPPPPLRNTSTYPACIEDNDCANDRRCFQYMCYPWQVGQLKQHKYQECHHDHDHHNYHFDDRPQLVSGGAASEKTVLLFSQRRAAIIGKIMMIMMMMLIMMMMMMMMMLIKGRMTGLERKQIGWHDIWYIWYMTWYVNSPPYDADDKCIAGDRGSTYRDCWWHPSAHKYKGKHLLLLLLLLFLLLSLFLLLLLLLLLFFVINPHKRSTGMWVSSRDQLWHICREIRKSQHGSYHPPHHHHHHPHHHHRHHHHPHHHHRHRLHRHHHHHRHRRHRHQHQPHHHINRLARLFRATTQRWIPGLSFHTMTSIIKDYIKYDTNTFKIWQLISHCNKYLSQSMTSMVLPLLEFQMFPGTRQCLQFSSQSSFPTSSLSSLWSSLYTGKSWSWW